MKNLLIILTLLLSFQNVAQKVNKKQERIAVKFINYVTKGNLEKSWKLFDKKNNPQVSKEQFAVFVQKVSTDLKDFDQYELYMVGKKFVQGKTLDMYTFKAVSTKKKLTNLIQIDVLFFKNSKLVAGMQPKQQIRQTTAASSTVNEILVEKSFKATINNNNYDITGINIVPFAGKKGMLVIQVDYVIPPDIKNNDVKMRKIAIPFAKYLIENNYLKKGNKIAQENGITLNPQLGVSFINKKTGAGYNVMLEPNEFK